MTGLGFNVETDVSDLRDALLAIHEVSREPRVMLGGRAVPESLRGTAYPFVTSSLAALPAVQALLDGPPQTLPPSVAALKRTLTRPTSTREMGDSDPVAERLVEVVAESSDLAREYMRQTRLFRDLALRDPVTGLGNRRAFDDRIYLHTHAEGEAGALLMIDVDKFKHVNDTHGHDTGDRILCLVGQAITASIRPEDFAARIGGDEFAAILPVTSLEAAHDIGERVRGAIAAAADLPVTVSIGAAPLAQEARAALLAADVALYEATASGRDRVTTVSPDPLQDLS